MSRATMAEPVSRGDAVRAVVLTAIWSALLAGVVQTVMLAIEFFARNHIVYNTPDVVWQAPLSYLAIFAVVAVPVAVVAAAVPMLVRRGIVTAAFSALVVFSAQLPFSGVLGYAVPVLALGAGVAMARFAVARGPGAWERLQRRQTLVLAVLIAVVGCGVRLQTSLRERSMVAQLPAAAPGAPNVLLIILDTVRAASLSLYGYARPTSPALDRLASSSVTFDNAWATAPWTLPSHASMFTGYYPRELSTDFTVPLDRAQTTLAEQFAARGYLTAGFVGNHHYTSWDSGLSRGFAHYADYEITPRQIVCNSWLAELVYFYHPTWLGGDPWDRDPGENAQFRIPPKTWEEPTRSTEITSAFLAWERTRAARPFFTFLNYYDAHDPRYVPRQLPHVFKSKQWRVDKYDNAVQGVDVSVGALLDTLDQRGVLDNTVVIVTADHGELFGEHGIWGHANSLYPNVLHVPLVLRYPARLPKGTRVQRPVSLRDLAATVADLSGQSATMRFPGYSLAAVAGGDTTGEISPILSQANKVPNLGKKFPASLGAMRSVTDSRLHYIKNDGTGREELLVMDDGSGHEKDITASAEGQALLPKYRAMAVVPRSESPARTTARRP